VNAVDVIVPIFNAPDDVAICLDALMRHASPIMRVWLVDDASTDPKIAMLISRFQERAQVSVKVLRNAHNLGFVGTVNRALGLVKQDVLLLNSDTIVSQGWIEAIATAAERVAGVASITPWSNNAEICSYPRFCVNNPVPTDLSRLAKACAKVSPRYPELPTGVGFCMFMSRAAIQRVGGFDQATFGRGYGEENDWCLRAAGMGFRNILCDDAFVAHTGGRSFAATGEKPGGENLRRLSARYPFYQARVAQFIAADPLAADRATLTDLLTREQL
jgi:GT2 family glycosyltransferase